MILGVAAYTWARTAGWAHPEIWILFPLVVRAVGLLASMVGILVVRGREDENAMNALNRGYFVAAGLSALGMIGVVWYMLGNWWFAWAGLVGLATSIAFVFITQYYTAGAWRPVKEIAEASRTGPATNIVSGLAVGFETTASTAIAISVALFLSFWFGEQSGVTHGGIFGTAVSTMGMLMTCAFILAMDTFGPITDNAGGIAEMSHSAEKARKITDALDAVGNTTKALTKGYAVGSAALAAFLLFSAYLDEVKDRAHLAEFNVINLAKVEVFIGALIGTMLVFLFSALAIKAVGKAASKIIEEVRRQFRENPGIMEGTVKPDYGAVVDLTARAALKNMIAPGLLAVGTPVVFGLVMRFITGGDGLGGAEAVGGLLMVGTIAGIILATTMNNGGGAWDNAKKYIEAGNLKDEQGVVIGKKTPTHAAAVVGDTVGDPFKDTAGPSLHVLVKLLSTITLVLAPLFLGK